VSEYIFIGLTAFAAAALHRMAILWIYRSWFRQGFAGDAAFHLAVVRLINRTGGYDGVPEFLIKDEPDTYPILFHRIAACFPPQLVERFPYLPNAVIWTVMTAGVSAYAHYVSSQLLHLTGPRFALTFLAVMLGLASNVSLDMNGLNYISLSERLLSRFCCGIFFLALAVFMTSGDRPSVAIAATFGTLTLISSMFGRQALFFIVPIVSLFSLNAWPLGVLAVSLLGAVVVDRGYFLRGLRHMSQFSHAYRNHTKHSRYYKLGLSRFTDLRTVLGRGRPLGSRIHELEHTEPTKILFRYPEVILLLMLQIFLPGQATVSEVAMVWATIAVYIATSTAALRHYGEANRYIEFALWLVASFSLAKYAVVAHVPEVAWLLYCGWIAAVALKKYRNWSTLAFPKTDVLNEFVSEARIDRNATVFTVPFSLGAAINVRAGCRALTYQGSAVTLALYEKFMEEIPFLKRDWLSLANEFQVSHVVCERSYLGVMKSLMGWEYDFSAIEESAVSDRYVAYRVTSPVQCARSVTTTSLPSSIVLS
jgi:hypothetical protein